MQFPCSWPLAAMLRYVPVGYTGANDWWWEAYRDGEVVFVVFEDEDERVELEAG